MKLFCALLPCLLSTTFAADRLPLTADYWQSEAFVRSFLGAYQPNNRIEPFIRDEERELLQTMQVELRTGDRDGGIDALRASALTKESAVLSFNLGNLLFEEGEQEEAVEAYQQALRHYPDFRRAHTALGIAYTRLEKYDEALPHLTRAVALGDQSGNTYGLLGYCRLTEEKYHAALQAYRLAQMTMPDVLDWKLGEAQCLHQLGDHTAAAGLFADAVKLDSADATVWLHYAGALMALESYEEAASALDVVRRLQGSDLEVSVAKTLGDLYIRLGLVDLAMERYTYALTTERPVPLAEALTIVEHVAQQLLWKHAGTLLQIVTGAYDIADASPDSRTFRRLQALVSMETGNADEAAVVLEELLSQDPMDGEALLLLARHRADEKAFEEAEMLLQQAKRVSSVEARAYLEHGKLQVARQDYTAALKNLEKARQMEPSERLNTFIEEVEAAASTAGAGGF